MRCADPSLTRYLAVAALIAAAAGCASDGGASAQADVGAAAGADGRAATAADVHRELLAALATEVFVPTLDTFLARAEALRDATASLATAPGDDGARATARAAWIDAMDTWQRAEVHQVGPAGMMGEVLGGEDLRDEIYSWSTTNRCRVDQETVEGAYGDPAAFADEAVNVRGLDALEYLLFREDAGNDCRPNSGINRDGAWAALGDEEVVARRAAYAQTAARLVADDAARLRAAWGDGGFAEELSRAGRAALFPTAQDALNAVTDAMFYVESRTKDVKLAQPAGLKDCDTDTCPEALESPYAGRSKEHVLANLEAFGELFGGAAGAPGFDDLLIAMGADELAADMTARLAAAAAAVTAVEGSFAEALATDPTPMRDAHAALKAAMDLFKTQFMATLDLEKPDSVITDND